jgi:ABC-type Mn2+/Zn2+ transport system permease subunit
VLPEAFDAPFMQRALVESLLLAGLAGVLGSWIVLRRLAFFTHGVGTAAFPGLVVAGPAGVAPQLTGLAAALLYAGGVEWLGRTRRVAVDAATGLVLVGALAIGVVLASDVFESGAGVDRLLFGSLIGLSDRDLWLTGIALAAAVALHLALRRSWLAQGFDPGTARALGVRAEVTDRLLLLAVGSAAVVALDAVGALLVTAVLVIPAATVRLVAPSVATLQAGTAALAAVEGVAGLWLAYELDVGPGPAIAVLGGTLFAAVLVVTAVARRWA